MQNQPLKRQIFNDDGELASAVFCLVCNQINDPEAEVCQRCGKMLTNEPSPMRSTLIRISQHNLRRPRAGHDLETQVISTSENSVGVSNQAEDSISYNFTPESSEIRSVLERITKLNLTRKNRIEEAEVDDSSNPYAQTIQKSFLMRTIQHNLTRKNPIKESDTEDISSPYARGAWFSLLSYILIALMLFLVVLIIIGTSPH